MIDKQKDRTITKKKTYHSTTCGLEAPKWGLKLHKFGAMILLKTLCGPEKKRNHAIWIGVGGIMAEGSAKQPRKITKHFFLHLYEDITQTERGSKKVAFATTRFLLGFLAFTPSKCQDWSRDYRENNETTHTHKSRSWQKTTTTWQHE